MTLPLISCKEVAIQTEGGVLDQCNLDHPLITSRNVTMQSRQIASFVMTVLTIDVHEGILCPNSPDSAISFNKGQPSPRGPKSTIKAKPSKTRQASLTPLINTIHHNVPTPSRRMALHAHPKHLGILPGRNSPLPHAQQRPLPHALHSLC